MKDREHPSRSVAGGDHRVGLLGGEGHDLVHHAMPARFQGPHGKFGVSVVRRGDDHELNLWVVEGLIQAGVSSNLPQLNRLRANRRIAGHDPMKIQIRLSPDQGAVKRPTGQPMPDHHRLNHELSPDRRHALEVSRFPAACFHDKRDCECLRVPRVVTPTRVSVGASGTAA